MTASPPVEIVVFWPNPSQAWAWVSVVLSTLQTMPRSSLTFDTARGQWLITIPVSS
jgi:hypothetical protein